MVRPEHTLVTWRGDLVNPAGGATLEQWSFGLRGPAGPVLAESNLNSAATQAKTAWTENLSSLFAVDIVLRGVEVARVGVDGRYRRREDGSFELGIDEGDISGTAAVAAYYPAQTALVASLSTARNGPTGKGRIFLPWVSAFGVGSDRLISVVDAQNVAGRVANFVEQVATAVLGEVQVVSSKGYASKVTGVAVGRVPDTMRSRRKDLIEDYVRVPVLS